MYYIKRSVSILVGVLTFGICIDSDREAKEFSEKETATWDKFKSGDNTKIRTIGSWDKYKSRVM